MCWDVSVSMEVHVFFGRTRRPEASVLRREIRRLGFPVRLDPGLDLDRAIGFQPAVFRGESAGFEFYLSAADAVSVPADLAGQVGGREVCGSFRWGGDLNEMACALCTAAALASVTDGVVYDPQDGVCYSGPDAIDMAREAVDAV